MSEEENNVIELSEYLEKEQDAFKEIIGNVVMVIEEESCSYQIVYLDKDENPINITKDMIETTITRLFEFIDVLCEEYDLEY